MRERPQRQSWRLTSRELHKLNRPARQWLKELWRAANDEAGAGLEPGPAVTELAGSSEARLAVIRLGYATRIVLAGPTEQPRHEAAWFGSAGDLPDTVRRVASDAFGEVMTLPDEVWEAYVANAAHELQKTLVSDWQELPRNDVDELLRWGYVLRCVDEAKAG